MDINKAFTTFIEWLKEIWHKINIKEWSENVGGSSAQAVQAAIYFGIFFALGFLLKKYLKFILISFIFSLVWLVILQYNNVIAFNRQAFNVMLGFDPSADAGLIMNSTLGWIKSNVIIVLASVIGFLIGCKLS